MRKYAGVAEITHNYLSGKLYKLTMEYIDAQKMKVSILYEDPFDYRYDYDIEVNSETQDFDFLGHQSLSNLFKVNLDRDRQFEYAVCNFLFGN